MSRADADSGAAHPRADPPRVLGGLAAFSIVAGSMLGVGIFLMPGLVAVQVASPVVFLLLWLVGGIVAWSGATACGELGAMLPRSGGDYVFQRAAFGPSVAFASGWVLFAAIFAGSIASMAVAVFQYTVSSLVGVDLGMRIVDSLPLSWSQLLAIALIVALTAINDAGTRLSGRFQTLFTLLPITAVLVIGGVALLQSDGAAAQAAGPPAAELGLSSIMAGFLFVYFTFSGWLNIIYVGGEVTEPSRNIPRSMLAAVLAVTLLYLALNGIFLAILGMEGLAGIGRESVDAGTGIARALHSRVLEVGFLAVIAAVITTSLNATVLASARVAFVMARDGAFWSRASALHERRRVPHRALWVQALLASLLVLSGTFDEIVTMASLAMLVTGFLTVLSLFVLRRKQPRAQRPYRASGYPWFPALYLLVCLLAIGVESARALRDPEPRSLYPLIGIAVFLGAFAGHRLFARRRGQAR